MFLYPPAVEHVANAGNGESSLDAPKVTSKFFIDR